MTFIHDARCAQMHSTTTGGQYCNMGRNMTDTFLSDAQVAARYHVNRATPWRWVKSDPTFPRPVPLSPGCTRWRLSALEAWESARSSRSRKGGGAHHG